MQVTKESKVASLTAMTGKFENLSTASNEYIDTQPPTKDNPPTPSIIPQYVHQISSAPRSPRSSSEGVKRSGEISRDFSGDHKQLSASASGDIAALNAHNPTPPPQSVDPQTVAAI